MMKIVFAFVVIIMCPFCSFSQQEWNLQNPVVKHYYEVEAGVIDAIDLSDSVLTNFVAVKKTKRYLDVYFDVFNKSCYGVAARVPKAEDLNTGELQCHISCTSGNVMYNIAFTEFRYNLINSDNSVMVAPYSHYVGFLRLYNSHIERVIGHSLNFLTEQNRITIILVNQKPKHIISQFKYFSFFNFGTNQVSFP